MDCVVLTVFRPLERVSLDSIVVEWGRQQNHRSYASFVEK